MYISLSIWSLPQFIDLKEFFFSLHGYFIISLLYSNKQKMKTEDLLHNLIGIIKFNNFKPLICLLVKSLPPDYVKYLRQVS